MTNEFRAMLDRFVLVYLDDILVYSRTLEEHLEHLRRVLETLRRTKYKANRDKCEFVRQELEYLDHFVTPQGINPLSDKIQAIQDWPEPWNVTDVRSFLGLASYYQHFIKGYSKIAAHLSKLQSEDRPFDFGTDARGSFLALKAALLSAEVLRIYDPQLPTRVTSDASGYGIGAVLEQHDGVDWHPVEYFSKKVSVVHSIDDARKKELLAFVHALKWWRHFLIGRRQFRWVTDNNPLVFYKTQDTVNRTIARWMTFIDQFDFFPDHIPGKSNRFADALSRRPDQCTAVYSTFEIEDDLRDIFIRGYQADPEFRDKEAIAMDITGPFPKHKTGVDGILTVVDRLTKFAMFLPCRYHAKAPELAEVTEIVTATGATAYRDKPGGPYSLRWDRRNNDPWRNVEDRNPRTLTDYRTRGRERDDESWRRRDDEIDRDRRQRELFVRARRLDDYPRSPRYEADRGSGDSRGRWETEQGRRDGYRDDRYERSDRDGYRDERYERSGRDGYRGSRYERGDRWEQQDGSRGRFERGGEAREQRDESRGWYNRGDRRDESRGRYGSGTARMIHKGGMSKEGLEETAATIRADGMREGGYGVSSEPYPKSPDPKAARSLTSRGADDRSSTPRNSCVYCRGEDHIKMDCPDLKRAIDEGLVVLDDRKYVKWADDLGVVSMFPSMKENVEARRIETSKGMEPVRSLSIKITFEGDIATTPIRVAATKSARGSTSKKTDTDYEMAEKDGQRVDGAEVILSPRKRGVKKFLMKSSLDEIDTVEPLRRALRQPMQCSILEYLAALKPARDELQMITRKTRIPLSEEGQGAPKAEASTVVVTGGTVRVDRMATVLLDEMEGVPPDKFYILGNGAVETIINDGAILDAVIDNGSEAVIIDEDLAVQVGLSLDRSYLFEIETTDGRKQQITGVCHKSRNVPKDF
ncbi:hypothetical protein CBR_g56522 [Chara braunii]|uniref:Reverse transcriptase domain-containing protein n=1 Tax=Chara braunii TaxID=69332 RepID=A0A388MDH8_CHABU|nr:hypothetical protein CBR_g56522 [Chara braunii]|eukprot:GBG92617.1 hypothetical protein CBR_g56522 [Chara braunii]